MPEATAGTGPLLTSSPGPSHPMASMAEVGLREGPVWHFRQQAAGGATRIAGGFDVAPGTVWEFAVFPDLEHDSTSNASPAPNFDGCHLALDFCTDDGVVRLRDQHEHRVDWGSERGCLVAENWNLLQLDLSPLAGRRVTEVRRVCEPGRTGGEPCS